MNVNEILFIIVIGIFIYYFYIKLNEIKSTSENSQDNQSSEESIESETEFKPVNIVVPTPFVDPYIDSYYDPFIYSYWDPYDLYPYGIIGVDAGADWNSSYYNYKRPHRHHKTHRSITRVPNNRIKSTRSSGSTRTIRRH